MELNHLYTGAARYWPDYADGPHRLIVAVFCTVGDPPLLVPALLDTGAEWCVLQPWLAERLGYDLTAPPTARPLRTRFGLMLGWEERVPVTFPAELGAKLTVQATCFVSADWPGPMVIGWKGCLERMRIALDPSEEAFYAAALTGEEQPF